MVGGVGGRGGRCGGEGREVWGGQDLTRYVGCCLPALVDEGAAVLQRRILHLTPVTLSVGGEGPLGRRRGEGEGEGPLGRGRSDPIPHPYTTKHICL